MTFSFLTLFPSLIEGYFQESILKNARNNNLISIQTIHIRDFALNQYKSVDSPQIGGGAGQVLCAQILGEAIESVKSNQIKNKHINTIADEKQKNTSKDSKKQDFLSPPHIIFATPNGKPFSHSDSIRLSQKRHIMFVCGRYEGFDERAIEIWADEVFCVGDFIMTGGELPALCMCDSIARQIPGVLGNSDSLHGESFDKFLLEAPVFARDTVKNSKIQKIKNFPPPSEYSKGNHTIIADLKNNLALCKTQYFRPDLFQKWKFTQRLEK